MCKGSAAGRLVERTKSAKSPHNPRAWGQGGAGEADGGQGVQGLVGHNEWGSVAGQQAGGLGKCQLPRTV